MAYTLTSKSQVTVPKAIREHLKLAPGDAVSFRIVADGGVRVEPTAVVATKVQTRAVARARKRFDALAGCGGRSGAASTDDLMRLLRGFDEDATDPGFAAAKRRRAP